MAADGGMHGPPFYALHTGRFHIFNLGLNAICACCVWVRGFLVSQSPLVSSSIDNAVEEQRQSPLMQIFMRLHKLPPPIGRAEMARLFE
uniref:Uncharacterized protein n=1 Tax=Strigamia maritima TaxID=126957 RepID=T1IL12_STRMM